MSVLSIIYVLLPGALGGVIAICATMLIERFGGVIGGIMGTTPTTIIPMSLGIALYNDHDRKTDVPLPEYIASSMFAVIPGELIDSFFLFVWIYMPQLLVKLRQRKRLSTGEESCMTDEIPDKRLCDLILTTTFSILLWFCLSFSYIIFNKRLELSLFYQGLIAALFLVFLFTFGVFTCYFTRHHHNHKRVDQPIRDGNKVDSDDEDNVYIDDIDIDRNIVIDEAKESKKRKIVSLALRFFVTMITSSFSVYISSINATAGGVFSTFPSIMVTTMVYLWLNQGGSSLGVSAAGSMILGCVSVCIYAYVFALCQYFGHLNVYLTAVISYASALVYSIPLGLTLYYFSHSRGRNLENDESRPLLSEN